MTANKDDWFREPCLSLEQIEYFEEKLKKSRSSRHEYIRIQAYALQVSGQYRSAITMIERIEAEDKDHYSLSWLYESKAECYLKLGCHELAIKWFRYSLQRENERPTVIGNASLTFPFWIATERMSQYYDEAVAILLNTIEPDGLFPVRMFKQYAALALIVADQGHIEDAQPSARAALLYAERTQSNAANHRTLGLVVDNYFELKSKLQRIIVGNTPYGGS